MSSVSNLTVNTTLLSAQAGEKLSGGAIVGIVFACLFGVIVLIIIAYLLNKRYGWYKKCLRVITGKSHTSPPREYMMILQLEARSCYF